MSMRSGSGLTFWMSAASIAAGVCCTALPVKADDAAEPAASSQQDRDASAREHFVLGRAAYRGADYDQALMHFRQAYELSGRTQLYYNIGISADRLGRNEEALEAFERYLAENEDPPREQEVRERIAFLRIDLEQKKQRELLTPEATARQEPGSAPGLEFQKTPSDRKMPKSAIAGGTVLAAVGVAGVVAMGLGISQSGSCVDQDASGVCVSERTTSSWTYVYGALGVAALAGSAAWFVVGSRRAKAERDTAWMLTPAGLVVSGSF